MKLKQIISIVGLFSVSVSAFALDEPLPRRGLLGAQLRLVEDELRTELGLDRNRGVQVLEVMPNTAAQAAGLQPRDIVLSVDGVPIEGGNLLEDAVNRIGAHRGGDDLALQVLRDGEARTLTARLTPMPPETYPGIETVYDHVTVDGVRHRAIVTKPQGDGAFPAVLYLQGLGCGSIDKWYAPDEKLAQFVEGLTNAGFVTVRVEKRGVGDSEGAACNEMDFQTELRGHRAALAYAQSLDYVRDDGVFLFGHSMGGVFAPMVAADQDVAGIIAFGTIGKPLPVYFMENDERQLKLRGATAARLQQQQNVMAEFIQLFFGEHRTPGKIRESDPKFGAFLQLRDSDDERFHGVHYTFWHQLNDIDIAAAWAKVEAPVLVIYGQADYAASQGDHPAIRDAVNAAHPGNATYIELENIGHGFETAATQKETMDNEFAGAFNPIIIETTTKWMRERL